MGKNSYIFKEGESVAHIGNLTNQMWIERILRQTKELRPKDGNEEHRLPQENKVHLIGIECHWWVGDVMHKNKFHSSELIPYHVAKTGQKTVDAWLNDR